MDPKTAEQRTKTEVIFAAGGIVWQHTPQGSKVAVVYRTRYSGKWSLPKGKLRDGESLEMAALREVKEETGCDAKITGFAGTIEYMVEATPKLVAFWHMVPEVLHPFQPNEEVKQILWLTPRDAIRKVDYSEEKSLLSKACLGSKRGLIERLHRYWGSVTSKRSGLARIGGNLKAYSTELGRAIQVHGNMEPANMAWAECAQRLLSKAEGAVDEGNLDEAWKCFLSAQRVEILGIEDSKDLESRTIVLRNEAGKLNEWRRKATLELIGSSDSPKEGIERSQLYRAALLRDEHYHNQAYKMGLLRSQLGMLSTALVVILVSLFIYLDDLPFIDGKGLPGVDELCLSNVLLGVILFGLLGGTLSAIIPIGKSAVLLRIPEVIAGFWITLMRIALGAGSALVVYVFLEARFLGIVQPDLIGKSLYTVFAISFIAGFSERLILKTVESTLAKG